MTYSLGWTSEEPKCPICHQTMEHEEKCPYEGVSVPAAIIAFQLDQVTRSGDAGEPEP